MNMTAGIPDEHILAYTDPFQSPLPAGAPQIPQSAPNPQIKCFGNAVCSHLLKHRSVCSVIYGVLVCWVGLGVPLWKGVVTRFIPIGICLIAVMQWRAYRKTSGDRVASQIEIDSYCVLPLKTISRFWGSIAGINLPEFLRPLVYNLYINCFGVNLQEAKNEDLRSYASLSDFFVRSLKPDIRPIDSHCDLVSPCDGTVLQISQVKTGKVEQVKGVTYSLEKFLGENVWNKNNNEDCEYHKSLLCKPHYNTSLYQCIIYLAPGDYHRFHSPAAWNPCYRRHFVGELLSVNPSIAKWIPGLFCLNERAVYIGNWKHGFFSYTAVGATNVGSVKVYFDETLTTNKRKQVNLNDRILEDNVALDKGDIMGEFRMGSTIVLLFEAPNNFCFSIRPGQKVRMGQGIGCVKTTYVDTVQSKPDVIKDSR